MSAIRVMIYAAIMVMLFLTSCDMRTNKNDIVPEWDRAGAELAITFVLFETHDDMYKALTDRLGKDHIEYGLLGKAIMSPDDNICEVYALRPIKIDDQLTMTIGHEVLHCVYGRYH